MVSPPTLQRHELGNSIHATFLYPTSFLPADTRYTQVHCTYLVLVSTYWYHEVGSLNKAIHMPCACVLQAQHTLARKSDTLQERIAKYNKNKPYTWFSRQQNNYQNLEGEAIRTKGKRRKMTKRNENQVKQIPGIFLYFSSMSQDVHARET